MRISKVTLNVLICVSVLLAIANLASAYDWVKHAGELYAINVPERQSVPKLTLAEAQKIVQKYRWIHVNSSVKTVMQAKMQAENLSSSVGRPVVLVYMPRHVGDGQRNDYHPKFQASLAALVKSTIADRKKLLVTSRSYGVHQALRVLRRFDSPSILLIGIAPAFGAFGGPRSANVKQYIKDVEQTRCKYCMIASRDDGVTWKAGGAAYRKRIGYRGDKDVGMAMERNERNVHIILLDGADHVPSIPDEYLKHGLVRAMRQAAEHFGMKNSAVGDVVYGRRVAEASPSTAQRPAPPTAPRPSPPAPGRTGGRRSEDSVRFLIRFPDVHLIHDPGKSITQIAIGRTVLSYGENWEVRRPKSGIYHLRQKEWKGFFWKVDTSRKRAYRVTGVSFGRDGGQGIVLEARVEMKGNRFLLRFQNAHLVHNPGKSITRIIAGGTVLSYETDWEVRRLKPDFYHLRQRDWKGFFWRVNTSRKRAYRVTGVSFEQYGGRGEVLNVKVEL